MLFLRRFLKDEQLDTAAAALYGAIATQARQPSFYLAYEVPDNVDGRFEMVALHAYLVFRRLKGQSAAIDRLMQATYDVMFREMDLALRELGAADLGVGKRIKHMAESLNGRIQSYDKGVAAEDDRLTLIAALRRNLYGTVEPGAATVDRMARYLEATIGAFDGQRTEDIAGGLLTFPDPDLI
ncbi:MAG: ubiquinol-cytochrome C chaperone family protein [Dongiaceae bacterium]